MLIEPHANDRRPVAPLDVLEHKANLAAHANGRTERWHGGAGEVMQLGFATCDLGRAHGDVWTLQLHARRREFDRLTSHVDERSARRLRRPPEEVASRFECGAGFRDGVARARQYHSPRNMDLEARTDDGDNALPQCLVDALRAADRLYGAVSDLPFPELNDAPSSLEEAGRIVHEALVWAIKMNVEHRAVIHLFPQRWKGVAVKVEPPVPRRMMMRRGDDGRPIPVFDFAPPEPAQGDLQRRRLSMSIASDVLEPLPERFEDSLASAFPFMPLHGPIPDVQQMPAWLAPEWETLRWDGVRKQLVQARLVVRAKCLGLVGWIRRSVAEIKAATLPSITWRSHRKNAGHVVEVSMAGAARTVDISHSEHTFLLSLSKADAQATRTLKAALMKKLPELLPYIESKGAGRKATVYSIPSEVRELIRVTPAR